LGVKQYKQGQKTSPQPREHSTGEQIIEGQAFANQPDGPYCRQVGVELLVTMTDMQLGSEI
jgi:hypothetical protein